METLWVYMEQLDLCLDKKDIAGARDILRKLDYVLVKQADAIKHLNISFQDSMKHVISYSGYPIL